MMRIELTIGGDKFLAEFGMEDGVLARLVLTSIFDRWLAAVRNPPPPPAEEPVTLRIVPFRVVPGPDGGFMLLLTATQKCGLTVDPRDSRGNVAPLDGAPTWTVSDPTILLLSVADDGLSAEVSAVGVLGTAQVNVSADARIGPDVKTIAGTLDVEVKASEAVTIGISSGAPAEQ